MSNEIKKFNEEFLTHLWLTEFTVGNLCGLCGNWGLMGPITTKTPLKRKLVMTRRYCICPNGRKLKEVNG